MPKNERAKVSAISMPKELRELIEAAAEKDHVTLTLWVAKVLAEKLRRPDLGYTPLARRGPKRK